MNEYDEQAQKFLRIHKVKLDIKKAEIQQPAPWSEGQSGYKYDITMTTSRGAYRFPFWDSIHNRQTGKRPTAYDVLACLDVWEGSIDEFVDEFGYAEQPTSKTIDIYNAVIDQSLQLRHILPATALKFLQEIN